MIYCGEITKNSTEPIYVGQFFSYIDSKTPLYQALNGNISADDLASIVCRITKGGVQSSFTLNVDNFILHSGSIASLILTTNETSTPGRLIISFENVTDQEIIFPCCFWFDVKTWSTEKLNRIIAAKSFGVWQPKAGVAGTYEILDADDGETVVLEAVVSDNSPVIYVVKI